MTRSRLAMSLWVAALLTTAVTLTTWRTGALAANATRTVTWSTVADQPYGTLEGSGIGAGGKLYSFGGYDVTKIPHYTPTGRSYSYNPDTNSWTALAALPAMNGSGHPGVTHAGIATDGTSIYLAGGYTSDASGEGQIFGTKEVWRYNPGSNTYTRMPDLPAVRAAGGLAVVGGQLHFFAGVDNTRATERPEHWALDLANPAGGWTARAPMPNPRNHLGTAVVGGRIYVVGGQHGQDEAAVPQSSMEVYNPATNAWSEAAPLPIAVDHTVAAELGGQLVVAGGQTTYNVDRNNAYSYDPATNTWTALSPLPSARFAGVMGTVHGMLYFAGGTGSTTVFKGTPNPPVTDPDNESTPASGGFAASAASGSSLQIGGKRTATGSRITLTVTVPGAGSVTARPASSSPKGKALIATATAKAKTAGPLKLVVKLTSAGRKRLKRRGKLTVKARVAFTPVAGAPTSSTIALIFKAKSKG